MSARILTSLLLVVACAWLTAGSTHSDPQSHHHPAERHPNDHHPDNRHPDNHHRGGHHPLNRRIRFPIHSRRGGRFSTGLYRRRHPFDRRGNRFNRNRLLQMLRARSRFGAREGHLLRLLTGRQLPVDQKGHPIPHPVDGVPIPLVPEDGVPNDGFNGDEVDPAAENLPVDASVANIPVAEIVDRVTGGAVAGGPANPSSAGAPVTEIIDRVTGGAAAGGPVNPSSAGAPVAEIIDRVTGGAAAGVPLVPQGSPQQQLPVDISRLANPSGGGLANAQRAAENLAVRDRQRSSLNAADQLAQRNALEAQRSRDQAAQTSLRKGSESFTETNFSHKKNFQVHIIDQSETNISTKQGSKNAVNFNAAAKSSSDEAVKKVDQLGAQTRLNVNQASDKDLLQQNAAESSQRAIVEG